MLQNYSQAHRDLILLVSLNKYNNYSEFVTVRWMWPTILLRGHGKMNIYNDNNYTLSFKSFQQRNGSTSVSLLNTLLFG